MDSLIIGLGYKSRNGKDSVANFILEAYKDKYDVRRYGFADALKLEVNEAAGLCGGFPQLVEWLAKEHGLNADKQWLDDKPDMSDPLCPQGKHSRLLQWWGAEYRRNKDRYYWVNKLEARISADKPQIALIADMRFPNEFEWVSSFKATGWTIKVVREGFVDPTRDANHESETALDGYEFDIDITAASGEMKGLKDSALAAMEHIFKELQPDLSWVMDFKDVKFV